MTPRLQDASEADIEAVAALAARTFPLACPPGLAATAVEAFIAEHLSPDALRTHLSTAGHHLLLMRDPDGVAAGYVLLVDGTEMDPDCAGQIVHRPTVGISKFYVDPAHHGTGLATAVLDEVARRVREAGAHSVWLATNVANARARRFYTRSGFEDRGNRTFVVGGVVNTDVVYELSL